MIPHDVHLQIGSLLFEGLDQIDLTGPFEVLSRIPNSTYRLYGKTAASIRDIRGLRLTPDATLADAPPLDVLHVPGGFGQEALMEDAEVLDWIRQQAAGACSIFSVCTGALLCGAAGLLKGRRATTHWASFHLLPFFGKSVQVVAEVYSKIACPAAAALPGAVGTGTATAAAAAERQASGPCPAPGPNHARRSPGADRPEPAAGQRSVPGRGDRLFRLDAQPGNDSWPNDTERLRCLARRLRDLQHC